MVDLRGLKQILNDRENKFLSPYAALSKDAVRRKSEVRIEKGHRQEFSVDSDRILHSAAYTRYIDKTQVFSLVDNDHITHRVLHVQLVSKISRTIGRFLGLNEDLIEAIALGHDVARQGGTAGAVLNAANEAAVAGFLDGRLRFMEIVPACRTVLDSHNFDPNPTLDQLLALDAWARKETQKWIGG